MFDGVDGHVGGATSGSMFATYQPRVVSRQSIASPLVMDANYVIVGNEITMTVSVAVDQAVTTSNNQVHFFVAREGVHGQSNLVVDMLDSEPLTITTPGESVLVQRVFTVDPEWINDDLRLVALTQSQSSKEILQATVAVADYAAVVAIDCEPDGVLAPWRLQGPEGLDTLGEGDKVLNVFYAGEYTLTWLEVPLWTTPASSGTSQTVLEDGTITFVGQYSNGPFAPVTAGPLGQVAQSRGASLVDFDNDGDLDIHVIVEGAPDQLLQNDGLGNFTDVASGLIADSGAGRAAAWTDFNGDGFQDVYLAKFGEANLLLNGDGAGGFTPASSFGANDAGNGNGASWIDFNLDGNLDLYVANRGGTSSLLNNNGDLGGGFYIFTALTDVTAYTGNCNTASWTDANLDGRLDLYLVNSFATNVMLENTPIGFDNVSNSSGLDDITNGTDAAWGDLDNDGDLDLYLANDGMADRLYRCTGDFQYSLVTGALVSDLGHARSVEMVDLDNDMDLDIYVVRHGQADLLLLNEGNLTFTRAPVGEPEADGPGHALATGDFDADGAVDIFITREDASNVMLKNVLAQTNNWFDLKLNPSAPRTDAVGTHLTLSAGGVAQLRVVTGQAGYQSMSSGRIHFGLGSETQVDQIEITWPDGTVQSIGPFAANMHLTVNQGENPVSAVGDEVVPVRVTSLGQAHPNPFNPSTTIDFALAQSGPTRLDVFDLTGRLVKTLVSQSLEAGQHSATWTGRDQAGRLVGSGAYFYRLIGADGVVESGRMTLLK